MKFIHLLFSKLGFSTGGHKACLKYGCKRYCGINSSEKGLFMGANITKSFIEGLESKDKS